MAGGMSVQGQAGQAGGILGGPAPEHMPNRHTLWDDHALRARPHPAASRARCPPRLLPSAGWAPPSAHLGTRACRAQGERWEGSSGVVWRGGCSRPLHLAQAGLLPPGNHRACRAVTGGSSAVVISFTRRCCSCAPQHAAPLPHTCRSSWCQRGRCRCRGRNTGSGCLTAWPCSLAGVHRGVSQTGDVM